ncbi:hypothetical protein ACHAXN_002507 [Cyclotella atomus]
MIRRTLLRCIICIAVTGVALNDINNANVSVMVNDTFQKSSNRRLYCMVPFIWTPTFLPQYDAIRKTWGKRCDVLQFYIDPIIGDSQAGYFDVRVNETAKAILPEDVVVVENIQRPWNKCNSKSDSETPCRNIWEKLWRSWILMDEIGELDKAEWFTKVDADTYLFADNLKRFVDDKDWRPNEQHYFGHVLMHRIELKEGEVRKGRQDCKDDYTSEEEVVTAVCLKKFIGLEAQTTLDADGKELIAVFEPEDSLTWNRSEQGEWWYWVNKPKADPQSGMELHQCCGDRPIAFHGYKDAKWFYHLENHFYHANLPVDEDENKQPIYAWRNPDQTKPYFERVKKALCNTN